MEELKTATKFTAFDKPEYMDFKKTNEILKKPVAEEEIRERSGGGNLTLRYVSGKYVIDRLIEATDNAYMFEVISHTIVQSEPKEARKWDDRTRKMISVLDENGNKTYEHQAPFVVVHGRLTIPGLGSREQYGSAEMIGGSSEQSEVFKSAATDCLKKCASLFGVALELYEAPAPVKQQPRQEPRQDYRQPYNRPTAPPSPTSEVKQDTYKQEDVDRLKALKEQLKITDNDDLNKYVMEFTGSAGATWAMITPSNIAAFNTHLQRSIPVEKA